MTAFREERERGPRLAAMIELLRSIFERLEREHDPHEQDVVYRAVLDHVRARRPESVGYLSQLPPPGEPIRDPRDVSDRASVRGGQ